MKAKPPAQQLIAYGNECLKKLNNWLEQNKLKLAQEKSQEIIFRGMSDIAHVNFSIGNNSTREKYQISWDCTGPMKGRRVRQLREI